MYIGGSMITTMTLPSYYGWITDTMFLHTNYFNLTKLKLNTENDYLLCTCMTRLNKRAVKCFVIVSVYYLFLCLQHNMDIYHSAHLQVDCTPLSRQVILEIKKCFEAYHVLLLTGFSTLYVVVFYMTFIGQRSEVRGVSSFCWFWWYCWPLLFKLSVHIRIFL
jgi:hypothetical protein